ncbi:hypothetical protein B296_00010437 [Ensete ventricosum]|uniref:CCHC-type domain-containing protein n=1 Tax=Ensete ventricosum TaxID=4639 RepID=A0A426YHV9_ENSVE|nr:hypothetical protein B296_00010437 [Ensete ventricosum]
MESNRKGGMAPTGCFKCGRPGHWSRDCPSSSANPNPSSGLKSAAFSSRSSQQPPPEKPSAAAATSGKKAPRTRPKLIPELLLSDDGLGYVLRHFPRAFKYHGRGHEVNLFFVLVQIFTYSLEVLLLAFGQIPQLVLVFCFQVADLGNLIGLYAQWHSHLIPYYSFDQFVHKVEQVGASKRVRLTSEYMSEFLCSSFCFSHKRCISELNARVARGGDPTKLHEPPVEQVAPETEQDDPILEDPVADAVDPFLESHEADCIQEEMFDEIYHKATEEGCEILQQEQPHASEVNRQLCSTKEPVSQNQEAAGCVSTSTKSQITEEQRARMEANRLRALQRAAARAGSASS